MKDFIKHIAELFERDTTGEGESNKIVIVMRAMEFAYIVNALICCCVFAFDKNLPVSVFYLGIAIIYVALLHLSYKIAVRSQIYLVNIISYLVVVISFLGFGTGTLVRNYFFVLVVLCFFSEYGHYKIKTLYSLILGVSYIILQIFINVIKPTIYVSVFGQHFLSMANIICPFLCIGFICYVYSKDSQHLEGKLIEYNNLLKKQASTDPLTGLCNRRSALEEIDRLIKRKSDAGFSVCMCDIDFFKKVNDSYGHDIGDNVLRGVASAMLEGLPKNCTISRWGGEEFLVIFPELNGDYARMVLETIRNKIKKIEFRVADKTFSITVTYGLAEYGFDGDSEKVVKEADNKLYYGKEHGRDQVVF